MVAQALKALLDEGYDAELLIVGSVGRGGSRFEETLRRRVLELGVTERVRFIGFVDRVGMAELLSAADVFCLASYTEGWPQCGERGVGVRRSRGGHACGGRAVHGFVEAPTDSWCLRAIRTLYVMRCGKR